MAGPTYYDKSTYTDTSDSSEVAIEDSTDDSANYEVYNITSTSGTTSYRRRILVSVPESWDEEDNLKFVDLVNEETNTGWTVSMIIRGDILITDPDIERRTMKEFVPLLKKRAGRRDRYKIDKFFNMYGKE